MNHDHPIPRPDCGMCTPRTAPQPDYENARIDHAAEAAAILDGTSIYGTYAEAQAHATLALVEQQRIANRIAAASLTGADRIRLGLA